MCHMFLGKFCRYVCHLQNDKMLQNGIAMLLANKSIIQIEQLHDHLES